MAILGSPKYRVGLIIANAQPFHNGHVKIISDALMVCDEVIVSFKDYDTAYFNYNFNQKLAREIYDTSKRIAFFGTKFDNTLGTPKHIIERTLDELKEARYNMPTHYFTNYDEWVEPAKELQLETIRVSTLPNNNSIDIIASIKAGTNDWKDMVPYPTIEMIETYIATKNRNF